MTHSDLICGCLLLLFARGDSLLMTIIIMMVLVCQAVDVVDRFVTGVSYERALVECRPSQTERKDRRSKHYSLLHLLSG